jgi:hypothetical protein
MEVLVNGSATYELVMSKGHARRVKVASVPAGQTTRGRGGC